MRNHNKLRAFELADEVAVLIYRTTKGFPVEAEKVLSALIRSMRKTRQSSAFSLQPKTPCE